MQVYGSLNHGENGGFDFLFLTTAFIPVLFFDKKVHYLSIFILSICAFIGVKIAYNYVDPILPFERQLYPYYFNVVVSSLLIYFGYNLFKNEHLSYEKALQKQKEKIVRQKETLEAAHDQLQVLLNNKERELEEKDKGLTKYAYLNSHKARSPLARILGLVHLTKLEDLNDDERMAYYFEEIQNNAKDLDKVLNEINQVLDNDIDVKKTDHNS